MCAARAPEAAPGRARTALQVRVIPQLRAVHLERHAAEPGEVLLYRSRNWDLGDSPVPSSCHRLTPGAIVRLTRSARVEVVELPEPLWVRALPMTLAAAAGFKIATAGRARCVVYAIENNDVRSVVGLPGATGSMATAIFRGAVGSLFAGLLDRIAYGSEGAARTYAQLRGLHRVPTAVFPELPEPDDEPATPERSDALFVGRLEARKGVPELLRGWEVVEAAVPQVVLTLAGDGQLRPDVERWVAQRPDRRRYLGLVPHADLGAVYAAHRVLIAPSRRDGRWREQIGLPIKEALSHGLTVVTTDETGLAEWLTAHGHYVYAADGELAEPLVAALADPLDPGRVVDALPVVDGRQAAHRWLRQW